MKRALLLSVLLAPLLPGFAVAQVTPERATALQDQLKAWLQSTLGAEANITASPVTVTAAGDHYDVSYPLSTGPDAPLATGRMTDAGNGRWAVDGITIPSPSVFRHAVPSGGEAVTNLTLGRQDQHMLIDPTGSGPSTLTGTLGDLGLTTQLPDNTQVSHVDSITTDTTITPVANNRLDIVSNGQFDGYTVKMSGPANQGPVAFSAGKASIASVFRNVSREHGTALLQVLARIGRTRAPAQSGAQPGTQPGTQPGAQASAQRGTQQPPISRADATALVSALEGLLTAASFDQRFTDVTVTTGGLTGSLKQLTLGLDSAVADGKLQARLPLVTQGLSLPPDLGLGDLAQFIPTRLALTPAVAGVPSAAVAGLLRKAVTTTEQPNDQDVNALFANGPINAGIDSFRLDVAGSSFAGNVAMLVSSPAVFSGTGQITAENIESLQGAISGNPQTAQVAPLVIFLKGIGRNEAGHLVWDIVYRDNRLLVNGQDMAALTGAPPPDRKPPAPRPARPNPPRP